MSAIPPQILLELIHAKLSPRVGPSGSVCSVCPYCSHNRRPRNQAKPCVRIWINARGAEWHCRNCEWMGDVSVAPETVGGPDCPGSQQRASGLGPSRLGEAG